MDLGRRLEDLPWLSWGANCYVYEVNHHTVVKVPKSGTEEREQFGKEVEIFNILSHHPPCPQLISCFLHSNDGIFLEYMRDICLSWRIQQNHIRKVETMQVIKVERLEPLPLRMTWMNDLSHGVAFLESLGYAHGDLRPENILLDRNRLKLADFDCTAKIGSEFEACLAPYGRLLGSEGGADEGTAGNLGPRTEQFALGSLYYLINYGFEVYGDRCFGGDSSGKEHGPVVLDLLQKMIFPKLDGEPMIDSIIIKCWHGEYKSVAELAEDTARLCGTDNELPSDVISAEHFATQRALCEKLVACGILEALLSKDPRQRKLPIERRWICWETLKN